MKNRIYPLWLNVIAIPILILVPIGLFLSIVGYTGWGYSLLFAGFLGIWIFGTIAKRKRING